MLGVVYGVEATERSVFVVEGAVVGGVRGESKERRDKLCVRRRRRGALSASGIHSSLKQPTTRYVIHHPCHGSKINIQAARRETLPARPQITERPSHTRPRCIPTRPKGIRQGK